MSARACLGMLTVPPVTSAITLPARVSRLQPAAQHVHNDAGEADGRITGQRLTSDAQRDQLTVDVDGDAEAELDLASLDHSTYIS